MARHRSGAVARRGRGPGGAAARSAEFPAGSVGAVRGGREVRDGFESRGDGEAVWRGRVEFDGGSRVVLTVKNGYVVGRIVSRTGLYQLRTLPTGGQAIERLDPAAFDSCAGGVRALYEAPATQSAPPSTSADEPDQINVMSLYTPQAETGAGGQAGIEALIQAAVDNANTAFMDSNMIARFTLIHTGRPATTPAT